MPAQTKDKFVGFWATSEQKRQVEEAARRDGRSISSFVRLHVTRAAESTLKQRSKRRSEKMTT